MKEIVRVEKLVKSYRDGTRTVNVLNEIDFVLQEGEFVAIRGASGAGKSTLLNIIGALDTFDSGLAFVAGRELSAISETERYHFRRNEIGFIFQHHHLLPDFTVLENVAMPLRLAKKSSKESKQRAFEMLKQVGLGERAHHYPSEISGGESQRAAVARAMVHNPSLILADEPTGNLDSKNTQVFIEILRELQNSRSLSIIIVTHENQLADAATKQYNMIDGQMSRH